MRSTITLLIPLLEAFSAVTALPHSVSRSDLASRQSPNRPKYSVVPLEPDNDDEPENSDDGNGESTGGDQNSGNKGNDKGGKGQKDNGSDAPSGSDDEGDDYITVVETVTRTHGPVTVTHSVHPEPITQTKLVPTTVISVVDMEGGETTVTVRPEPETIREPPAALPSEKPETKPTTTAIITTTTPSTPAAEKITAESSSSSSTSTTTSVPEPTPVAPVADLEPDYDTPPAGDAHQWQPEPPATVIPTTLSTLYAIPTTETSASSTSTDYDNGQWHTTYPSWNETAWRAHAA
ncbi:hypothetical protein LIA77_01330 [Sarocladium implicatum]|nr:hypothetical protein LIA77_01330 [Sarocladium implicatum]